MERITAYTGAVAYPIDGPRIDDSVLLVSEDKIRAIGGPELPVPTGVKRVDLSGRVIMPGLVDAHSHVGIMGDGEGPSGNDANEMPDPVNGKIRVLDSVNPAQASFAFAREGGITTACIVPLGNPIAGLSCACKTAGRTVDQMVVRHPTGLKVALGEGPKRSHGQSRKQAPFTRMGIASLVRDYFYQAREQLRREDSAAAQGRPLRKSEIGLGLQPGVAVLRGEIPLRVHAHRQDDIATAVRLAEEFDIPYRIEHCTAGYLMADFLGQRHVIAHVGPGLFSRGSNEWAAADERNAAILDAAGVKICLITDHPFLDSRYMLPAAAVVHKYGMPFDRVLRALTLNPAESLGIAGRAGSLTAGKDADFIVLSGEPLRYRSVILSTFIQGREVYTRT